MVLSPAEKRLFENVYVCMKCKAKIRSGKGKPDRCRKCGSKELRPKKKRKKTKA